MKKMRKFLAALLSLALVLTLCPMGVIAVENESGALELAIKELDSSAVNVNLTREPNEAEQGLVSDSISDDEAVKVIIVMEEESVIDQDSAAVISDETVEMTADLEAAQAEVVAEIEKTVLEGEELEIGYSYTWLLNAVSAEVPYGAISDIEAVDGVKQVLLQRSYEVCEDEVTASDVLTNNDGVMIGREPTWNAGYTGEGMVIAVIDTGIDKDHQNFQALDASIETNMSKEDVAAVLGSLNASNLYRGLTIDDVYSNSKVVFGFNYCDSNTDYTHDNDSQGDHGTHVAGIAAANKVEGSEAVGVARDAQLMAMKVFGLDGGAYDDDILAALEDAMMLGADVINLSLGSPAGFTSAGDYGEIAAAMSQFYDKVAETDVVLTISAGNNYQAGFMNNWGTDANQTLNPDNGVLGSPGAYHNVLSVASVENIAYKANYIAAAGSRLGYMDSAETYGHAKLTTLTGEYELVVVPGVGDVADFEGLDLTGKVALIQRGSINFSAKVDNAAAAGAVAALVYNNTSGEFGMNLEGGTSTIPAVSITLASGEFLIASLAEDPSMTVSFPKEPADIASEAGYAMSDFSSWGPAPDLSLEPDITAPGGNIYSTLMNGEYGTMSGTSMAAPNMAGISALVMQYVRDTFSDSVDTRVMVRDLLMSTSTPLVDEGAGLTYSPRKQGSGLASVFAAVTTQAYLTVDGSDTAKVQLGDDDDRTGAYSYSFNVHNFGDTPLFYDLNTTAQTEGVISYGYGGDGYDFMSGTPVALGADTETTSASTVLVHDVNDDGVTGSNDAYWIYQTVMGNPMDENWNDVAFRYDSDYNEGVDTDDVQAYLDALVENESPTDLTATVMMVEGGETAEVDVTVTLTDNDKAYLDFYYANGGYVEGYTYLTALNSGSVDLSLPYMGFYGDWAEAPVLDEEVYHWDNVNYGAVASQYFHALLTPIGNTETYLGLNAYIEEEMDPAHMVISPDGNGYVDGVSDIYVSLLRNAAEMTVRYTDANTGEVYYEHVLKNAPKSCYSSANGMVIPFVYSWYAMEMYDFEGLANNTELRMDLEFLGVAEGETKESLTYNITVDTEAPMLQSASLEDGILTLTFTENVSTAAVGLLNMDGTQVYELVGVEDVEKNAEGYQVNTVSFDASELTGKVMVALCDYGLNERYYALNMGGEGASYGDMVAYQYNFYTGTNGWVSFGADVDMDETILFAGETDFVCAEYVNGYVFAQTEDGKFYGIRYEDMLSNTMVLEDTYITTLGNVYQDLTYNYFDGNLYGLVTYADNDGYPTSEIVRINLKGEYYDENMWSNVAPYQEDWILNRGGVYGLTLASDDTGRMYILGTNYDGDTESLGDTAHLWSVGFEYDQWSDSYQLAWALTDAGDTGITMDYLQSMTWNHNDETLYWARFDVDGFSLLCELYAFDINVTIPEDPDEAPIVEFTCEQVGELSGETCGLFAPLNDEAAAKPEHANVPSMDPNEAATPILRDDVVTMNIGGQKTLTYDVDPWYSDLQKMVWSSSDESVVTVDENGVVTAVAAGSATVTVANAADETKCDTVSIEVTALDLVIEGVISAQTAGIGTTTGVSTYKFQMDDGVAKFGTVNPITAPAELNFGLSLATSELGRGSLWATEYGNTGMVYEIDPSTGVVKDVLQPIDGDMLFGLSYSDEFDTFTGIMNYYLYVDLALTHEEEAAMMDSYDAELNEFTYHKINMLSYLKENSAGFTTGETGNGASSEVVFCGVTTMPGGYYFEDTYKDYKGSWDYSGNQVTYIADQTIVLLDNVGRLWYIDEIVGMTKEADEYGNAAYMKGDGSCITSMDGFRKGVFEQEIVDAEGNVSYNLFNIRKIEETPLTAMFHEGSMPRITYHFSDIEYAGKTNEGAPMFAMSLYDYWNEGTTNELYLYVAGIGTGEWVMDYETWESYEVMTESRFYNLGDTGANNIIASIHSVEVTGGVDPDEVVDMEIMPMVNPLTAGVYSK